MSLYVGNEKITNVSTTLTTGASGDGGTELTPQQLANINQDHSKYLTQQSLNGYATENYVNTQGFLKEHQDITGKQDVISDLATIRSGASKGATALQSVPTGYATQTWVNQQGFLKEHQSLSGYATESFVTGKGYITSSALANISSTSVTTTNLTINGWAVTIV